MLNDKIALITGGCRGIGRAVALEFAKAGATVILNDVSSEDSAQEVLKEIKDLGGQSEFLQFNVTESDTVEEKIKYVLEKYGRIDILVNNAGITRDSLFMRMKEEQWDEVFNVNMKGVFHCTKNVVRSMIKNKYGKIINVASVAGEMGNPGQANYASTKSGIMGFTKSLAKELGSKNINVNAVSPGFIMTHLTDVLPEETKEKYKELIPLSRFGEPEDVAKAILFLASDDSSYITGEILRINGGLYT
jgi:3-oxoacyl-[acyl-carrier protein] reductase